MYRQADAIAVLTVESEIDPVTAQSLERRMAQARADGANAVVISLDTPGGDMGSMLDICALMKSSDAPANTVAWINPTAYSAGSIIALACREIVTHPNSRFGDAAPIYITPTQLIEMKDTERAKIEAPILTEVIDSARRNHYDESLVQAFISVGVELWLIEHVDTGELAVVDREEYEAVFGEEPDENLTPTKPSKSGSLNPRFNTLFADQLAEIQKNIERNQDLPSSRKVLTEADRGQWKPVTQIISDDRLLTITAPEALLYGLAQTTVSNEQELLDYFGAASVTYYHASWSEGLVRILISWPVRIVLIIVFLVGLFLEMAAPGLGVFGGAAMVALLVLIGAPYLAGMAQWWEILLIVTGILLIAAEVLVIPGTGLAGFLGAACLLVGMIGTFITTDISSTEGQEQLWTGVGTVLAALVGASIGIWLLAKNMKSIPMFDRLALNAEVSGKAGAGIISAMAPAPTEALSVGDLGTAQTDLRPSGRGVFGDRVVDVQSVGSYIEQGAAIRVVTVDRYVIEVEEADS